MGVEETEASSSSIGFHLQLPVPLPATHRAKVVDIVVAKNRWSNVAHYRYLHL